MFAVFFGPPRSPDTTEWNQRFATQSKQAVTKFELHGRHKNVIRATSCPRECPGLLVLIVIGTKITPKEEQLPCEHLT